MKIAHSDAITCRTCDLAHPSNGVVAWCTRDSQWKEADKPRTGCDTRRAKRKGDPWTTDEVRTLTDLWPEHGNSWSGWGEYLPGRTYDAIAVRASQMGLVRTSGGNGVSVDELIGDARPCPFCGERPREQFRNGYWGVFCDNAKCPAYSVLAVARSHEYAVAHWNIRRGI